MRTLTDTRILESRYHQARSSLPSKRTHLLSVGPLLVTRIACMKALLEAGYGGYVGHEFIPTGDPLAGLIQAVSQCDV